MLSMRPWLRWRRMAGSSRDGAAWRCSRLCGRRHLAFVLLFVPTGRLLSRSWRVAHRCDGRQQSTVNS
jgi:hypothetical protein